MSYSQIEPFLIYRNWETGAMSHDLRAVLPQRLTVARGYRRQPSQNGGPTLFREVEIVPYEDVLDAEALALLDAPIATTPMTRADNVRAMAAVFEQVIAETWRPDKFHLVFHSGGYDSRIISAAIRNVASSYAPILFVCLGHEGDVFEQVMRAEGWDASRMLTIRNIDWLIARIADLHDAGRWLNGAVLSLLDFNWLLVEHLQRLNLIPADDDAIQLFSGRNEALMGATMPERNRMRWAVGEAYTSHLGVSRYKVNDVVFPFTHYATITTALASGYRVDWSTVPRQRRAGWRRDIGIALCPALADIPHTAMAWPPLTAAQVAQTCRDYAASWYGRLVWPGAEQSAINAVNDRHPWWGAFSAAALCEALIEEGYELTVG